MKRTVTTCVDVPRSGNAASGRAPLRVELTFAADEPATPAVATLTLPGTEQPAPPAAGKQKGPDDQRPEPADLRPTRRRTVQEESASPPHLCPRQAGEAARRIATTLAADGACDGNDPEAFLEVAARFAADYLATMQTLAPGGQRPTLLRVRVGEVDGRTFVDLEP